MSPKPRRGAQPPASAAPQDAHRALLHPQDSPFYQVWVLTNLTAKPFTTTFGRHFHLTLNDWRIMLTVADHPGVTAQELSEYTGLDKMSVSRAVRSLESQGRLVRQSNEADRRMRHLFLTDAGWEAYTAIATGAQRREAELYEGLSAAELKQFHALLLKLLARARRLGFADEAN